MHKEFREPRRAFVVTVAKVRRRWGKELASSLRNGEIRRRIYGDA